MAKAGGGGGRGGGGGKPAATLEGSPKQVSWANDIRRRQLARLDSAERHALGEIRDRRAAGKDVPKGMAQRVRSDYAKARANLRRVTSARWWIDRRKDTPRQIGRFGLAPGLLPGVG